MSIAVFSHTKPLKIQTHGESHVSRIQTRSLCNSICRPDMSQFAERSHKNKKKNKGDLFTQPGE